MILWRSLYKYLSLLLKKSKFKYNHNLSSKQFFISIIGVVKYLNEANFKWF